MPLDDSLSLVGSTVSEKYRVDSLVAEGGFAFLYRATHILWKRPVALKVFKAMGDMSRAQKEEMIQSFIREGALLADLSERSASICQARDIGMLETRAGESIPFMVLEWLEGSSLEAVFTVEKKQGLAPRSIVEAMVLLGPIGEALALAHARGVVHRDVKPANIFLLGDPRAPSCSVKLLDFGVAKVVMDVQKASAAFAATSGVSTAFTPGYAAPEQFSRSLGPTGPWTDTFSLALVVVECLTGEPALTGDDFLQIAFSATNPSQRPTPRSFGALVSDEVEAVFERALAVEADARYATVGEFWNALREAVGQGPMSIVLSQRVLSPSVQRPTGLEATEPSQNVPPASTQPSVLRRRGMGIAIALSIAAAALTVVGGWAALTALHALRGSPSPRVASSSPPLSSASAAPLPPPAPPPTTHCPDQMVYVPEGQFFMGSDDEGASREKPSHNVKLSAFCIDIYEVTTSKYVACSDLGKCKRASLVNEFEGLTPADRKTYDPLCNLTDPARHAQEPINCVDWERADIYCKAASGRLPTEAEWEYAARGSDGRTYPWGDDTPSARHLNACGFECVAWGKAHHVPERAMYQADDGWPTTAPVGSFPQGKSRFGLYDIVGNVWEWVSDWYAPYTAGPATDPKGPPSGKARVMRGGGWNGADPTWVKPTFRYMNDPSSASYGVGFRCAADPK